MMNKKIVFIILTIFFLGSAALTAQVIPDSITVNWSKAGYRGNFLQPSLIINVKDFGAYGDGVHDDYNAVVNAINSSSSLRVIYFPAGNYFLTSTLSLPGNVILRGEGDATILSFNLSHTSAGTDCIKIEKAQKNNFTRITGGYTKGSKNLSVADITGFSANGYAEIHEANGNWDTNPAKWAAYSVGQIVEITAIKGNTLIISPALRIDYTETLQPEIRPVTLKKNAGIECLKITRIDSPVDKFGSNIRFAFAMNCWIAGVESSMSQGSHVMLASSKNITITGCYFHDAFTYDGVGTAGYGVTMIQHNSDCKVENSIFRHLRHAMVAKQGANGNVFAYNYSIEPYRTEEPTDAGADMVLHGHYAFANLFEGNIGQSIFVDDAWGPSGPYNTFFRNRAELYGIVIFNQPVTSDKQNIVGNEVTNTGYQKGNFVLFGNNHFTYGNNIRDTIKPADTNVLNDKSYYLKKKPSFWSIPDAWPSIGIPNALNSGTNPAKERYLNNVVKTVCPVVNTGEWAKMEKH